MLPVEHVFRCKILVRTETLTFPSPYSLYMPHMHQCASTYIYRTAHAPKTIIIAVTATIIIAAPRVKCCDSDAYMSMRNDLKWRIRMCERVTNPWVQSFDDSVSVASSLSERCMC